MTNILVNIFVIKHIAYTSDSHKTTLKPINQLIIHQ